MKKIHVIGSAIVCALMLILLTIMTVNLINMSKRITDLEIKVNTTKESEAKTSIDFNESTKEMTTYKVSITDGYYIAYSYGETNIVNYNSCIQ